MTDTPTGRRPTRTDAIASRSNACRLTVSARTVTGISAGDCGIFGGTSATPSVNDSVVVANFAPIGADLDDLGFTTSNDGTIGVLGH